MCSLVAVRSVVMQRKEGEMSEGIHNGKDEVEGVVMQMQEHTEMIRRRHGCKVTPSSGGGTQGS